MNREARKRSTIKVLTITPLIVASMVIGGAFLGFSLADLLGLPKAIMGVTLATLGLFVSLPIVVRVADRIVRKEIASVEASKSS